MENQYSMNSMMNEFPSFLCLTDGIFDITQYCRVPFDQRTLRLAGRFADVPLTFFRGFLDTHKGSWVAKRFDFGVLFIDFFTVMMFIYLNKIRIL